MSYRTVSILIVGICLLLLTLAYPSKRNDTVAGSADEGLMDRGVSPPIASITPSGCLPRYGEPEFILTVNVTSPLGYEPFLTSADFNGDGLDDVVITKLTFQTYETYELDVLLNDRNGSLVLATSGVFSGTIPAVSHPRQVVIADFNGDGVADIFVADHGYDDHPYPGYQNQLALSAPDGQLVNATGNLPQQDDFTHSAAAADIDGDEDVDLYIGNLDSQTGIPPQVWLNVDGAGVFTVATGRLPLSLQNYHYGSYTASEFVDVNNDSYPDLVLGDGGRGWPEDRPDSLVLLNDGTGRFSLLDNGIPAKPFDETDTALDIDADDMNGDGYQDLFIAFTKNGYVGRYIQVLISNQDGTFRDETGARLPQSDNDDPYIYQLQLMDMDRDQDMDLIARPWEDENPDPLLFLNDGNGHFSREPLDFKLPYLYYTSLDLDGDGGHDLVFATYAPPEDIYAIRDLGCPVFLPFVCRNRSASN